jgi:hypothetical protein
VRSIQLPLGSITQDDLGFQGQVPNWKEEMSSLKVAPNAAW